MNIKDKVTRYFDESVVEMKKVTYPSKQEVIGSTIVVIITSVVVSLFIWGVDSGLNETITLLLQQ